LGEERLKPIKLRRPGAVPFLTVDDVRSGDILEIVEKPQKSNLSKFGERYVIGVQLPNGQTRMWTLNKTTFNDLLEAFGDLPSQWVGQHVRVEVSTMYIRGERRKAIFGEPVR